MAIKSTDQQVIARAMKVLEQGYDLSLIPKLKEKPLVEPKVFASHFEKLFAKKSERETLGLSEEKVGPKVPPNKSLSGAPTFVEISKAVGKLRRGTAPGVNGLRPEMFKKGGSVLVRRLVKDFEAIWPAETDENALLQTPPQDAQQARAAKVIFGNYGGNSSVDCSTQFCFILVCSCITLCCFSGVSRVAERRRGHVIQIKGSPV
jgi:hypothetical protein